MKRSFYIYDGAGEFGDRCVDVCERYGFARVMAPSEATFAIATKLLKIIPREQWAAPELGTLIFHPSVLPYHRGPDAIRWAVLGGERVSGVTWFWAEDGLDTGPICEQEAVLLDPKESPRRAYHTRFIPAGIRALERAVWEIFRDRPRRVPQEPVLASYESFHSSNQHENPPPVPLFPQTAPDRDWWAPQPCRLWKNTPTHTNSCLLIPIAALHRAALITGPSFELPAIDRPLDCPVTDFTG